MKNVHVLPTGEKFAGISAENIYITSDEEIKDVRPHKGKWHLEKENILNKFPNYLTDLSECKLVIMTTDQNLIKDGVQAIDDEVLEWFVKNPSCEKVEVRKIEDELISPKNQKIKFNALQDPPSFISAESLNNMILTYKYKIIIPKEEILLQSSIDGEPIWGEPKQETLEEFAEKEAIKQYLENTFGNIIVRKSIEKGAKWQEEQTIEEVFEWLTTNNYLTDLKETLIKDFNNFKRK